MPFPPPGHLPDPGIEPTFLALAGTFFITEAPGTGFMEDNFSTDRQRGRGDGLGMIQVPYIWWLR